MDTVVFNSDVAKILQDHSVASPEGKDGVQATGKSVVIQGNNNVIQLTTAPPKKVVQGTPGYRVGLIIAAALAWGLLIGIVLRDYY